MLRRVGLADRPGGHPELHEIVISEERWVGAPCLSPLRARCPSFFQMLLLSANRTKVACPHDFFLSEFFFHI